MHKLCLESDLETGMEGGVNGKGENERNKRRSAWFVSDANKFHRACTGCLLSAKTGIMGEQVTGWKGGPWEGKAKGVLSLFCEYFRHFLEYCERFALSRQICDPIAKSLA